MELLLVSVVINLLISLVMCLVGPGKGQLAEASFNDTRCDGETVCPDTPLLFTCIITRSWTTLARVMLPSGERVNILINSDDTTSLEGEEDLPDGMTIQSHNARREAGLVNFMLTLSIESVSILTGSATIVCEDTAAIPLTTMASCPVATSMIHEFMSVLYIAYREASVSGVQLVELSPKVGDKDTQLLPHPSISSASVS